METVEIPDLFTSKWGLKISLSGVVRTTCTWRASLSAQIWTAPSFSVCIKRFPALHELQREMRDRDGGGGETRSDRGASRPPMQKHS